MVEFQYTVKDPNGIHARPAGELVKYAKKFASSITVKKGEKIVYKEYSTTEIRVDEKDYIILKEEDILATL